MQSNNCNVVQIPGARLPGRLNFVPLRLIIVDPHVALLACRILIYLVTATGLSPCGSSTVHVYTQTIHGTTQITTNLEECGPCPVFASFTLAFALQLRKKLHLRWLLNSQKIRVPVVQQKFTSVLKELAGFVFRPNILKTRAASFSETTVEMHTTSLC